MEKYVNSKKVLPESLIKEIQKYVKGHTSIYHKLNVKIGGLQLEYEMKWNNEMRKYFENIMEG